MCGRCVEGDGGDKKSVFYAESVQRCVEVYAEVCGGLRGGARKVMVGTKNQYFMLSQCGGARTFTRRCTEVYTEVRRGLCGGAQRFAQRFFNPSDLIGCGGTISQSELTRRFMRRGVF